EAEKISKAISDKINGVANTANNTANTLKDVTLPALLSRVSTAEQKITADAIVGTVTSSSTWATQSLAVSNAQETADTVVGRLDNLVIGGRNFASLSSKGWSSNGYNVMNGDTTEDWVVGEAYTITIQGTVSPGQAFGIWRDTGSTSLGQLKPIN